ncbi:MAG: hypothetical protein QOI66_819 [Myxococcales bacterium]|jgi:hypothetical protein|nr:hypothetical protein [Myxococcales bacterium]
MAEADCPSGLQIARWEAGRGAVGEDGLRLAEHVRSCARCSTRVAEIADARGELFPGDAARESARVAHALLVADAVRRARGAEPSRWRWRWAIRWAGLPVLAGAAAVFLLLPRLHNREPAAISESEAISGADDGQAGVRVKGHLVVQAFCKRKDAVFPVEDGGAFLSGDRLRFAYSAPSAGNLMIFGVDDGGQIFPYYGDDSLHSVPVAAGAKAMLPGSVELDDHHGLERVFALWAARPLDGAQVRQAVASALSSAGDIARVRTLGLSVDQVSYLLRRP